MLKKKPSCQKQAISICRYFSLLLDQVLECCGVWPHWKNERDRKRFKQMASIWMIHLRRIAYEYLSFYRRICISHCMSNQKKLHKHRLPLLSIHNLHWGEKKKTKQRHFPNHAHHSMIITFSGHIMCLVSIKCFHLWCYRILSMTIHSFGHILMIIHSFGHIY